MTDFIQITTTLDDADKADAIADALVEKRLAACVQVLGPVLSIYRWDGEIEEAEEWQVIIKTSAQHFGPVEQLIKSMHDYDTPEIVATPIIGGSAEYLEWMGEQLK